MDNKILILQFVIFIGGVNNLTFPFLSSYSHLVGYAILAGVTDSFLAVMSVIPQYLVGIREAVNAFGVLSFTSSITGALAGPVGGLLQFTVSVLYVCHDLHCLTGWSYDFTGSYNVVFYVAGGLSVATSLLMFTDFCFMRQLADAENKTEKQFRNVIISVESSV